MPSISAVLPVAGDRMPLFLLFSFIEFKDDQLSTAFMTVRVSCSLSMATATSSAYPSDRPKLVRRSSREAI